MTAPSNNKPKTAAQWTRTRWTKIVLDVALLVGFLAEFITREGPDYSVHSWIGVVLIPVIGTHLVGNLGWIRRVWARKRQDREFGLGVVNAALGFLASTCIVTGFPLWFEWVEGGLSAAIHTITGFLSILTMFVHLWKNRRRIGKLVRQ